MFNRIFAAAAVGSMMIAAPAIAGDEEGNSVSISYADLNLNSEAGQAELEKRVFGAARQACQADGVQTGSRILSADKRRCLSDAKKSAKMQVAAIIEDARRGG